MVFEPLSPEDNHQQWRDQPRYATGACPIGGTDAFDEGHSASKAVSGS
jgi:hypothetical protein